MSLSVREYTQVVVWQSTLSWLIQSLSAKTGAGNDSDYFQPSLLCMQVQVDGLQKVMVCKP